MDPFPDVDTWLAELTQLDGVRSAVLDPASLQTPGVWCRVPSFGLDTLADDNYRLDVELYLVVGDAAWRKARKQLMDLFSGVHDYLGKPRIAQARFVLLEVPEGPALPALLIPHTLRIVPDPPTDD